MSTFDFSFSQVTEVEKREPRKSFSKPKPDFWGRGRRPRPRNEQAEAEKCFRGSLFSTEVTWEKLKSDVDQISSEESSQHNYQNRMLFSFVWLFRRFHQAIRLWNSFDIFWNLEVFFDPTLWKKFLSYFLPNQKILSLFQKICPRTNFYICKNFSFRLGQIFTYVKTMKEKDLSPI